MQSIPFLAVLAALTATPVSAQSVIQLKGLGERTGPNAQAAQRPLGPNGRAAQRQVGPNGALVRESERRREVYYPSCAAVGVSRAPPIRRGEPGYGRHLDPDGDGIACE